MNTGDSGEFGLIERLKRVLGAPSDGRLAVGIGDDAGVWRTSGAFTVATTDTMVAGVHFLPGRVPWRDIGWKALATNISDIAAMGAAPSFALVTLCLPSGADIAAVEDLYGGLRECAEAFGVTIAGGDVVASDAFTITVALIGEAATGDGGTPRVLRRDAACDGDAIAVTGPLGGAAGGLRMLLSKEKRTPDGQRLVQRHMRPQPRLDWGGAAVSTGVRSAIDISDGLIQDLGHICAASGLAAEIRAADVPVEPGLSALFADDALTIALSGGEDYELVLVAPEAALRAAAAAAGEPLHIIGRMLAAAEHRVRVLDARGAEMRLERGGWDHLRDRPSA